MNDHYKEGEGREERKHAPPSDLIHPKSTALRAVEEKKDRSSPMGRLTSTDQRRKGKKRENPKKGG